MNYMNNYIVDLRNNPTTASNTNQIRLPDMEFVWNYGDWPLTGKNLLPLISWCGSTDSNDFVLPTYDIATSTYEAMYRSVNLFVWFPCLCSDANVIKLMSMHSRFI